MKEFFRSKMATVLLTASLAVILFVTARLLAEKYKIDRQITELEARAERIKGDNQQLSDLVKYLNTPQYQEKEAREKLNLKKDGEYVVGLPRDQADDQTPQAVEQISNPKKWFNFFFKKS